MIIFQVDAQVSRMGKEDIEHELKVIEDMLAATDGKLIKAAVSMDDRYLVACVCAESNWMVSDIFDASDFTVEKISYLGLSHEAHINLPKCLSWQDGQLCAASAVPAFASAAPAFATA